MGTIWTRTMQSLGKIAPSVGAKMWYLFFFSHAPSPEHRAFEGCIVRTCIALPFIGRFRRSFQLFQNGLLFQMHCIIVISVASWRHNFREIAIKNCENSKKSSEKFVRTTSYRQLRDLKKFYCSSLAARLWMCIYIIFFPHVAT